MSPCAEHILDWFHVAMRLTVLSQYAKGLAQHSPKEAGDAEVQIRAANDLAGTSSQHGKQPELRWGQRNLGAVRERRMACRVELEPPALCREKASARLWRAR